MAHVTVYLPEEIAQRARLLAEAEGASLNQWIASRVVAAVERLWSLEFLAAAGADPDFPEVAKFLYGTDGIREEME